MLLTNRLQIGRQLALQSFAILRANKKLLLFPGIAAVLQIAASFLIFLPLSHQEDFLLQINNPQANNLKLALIIFAVILLFFLILHMISFSFNAAILDCSMKYLQNEPYSLYYGFKTLLKKLWPLLCFKVTTDTAGVVIQFLEYWKDDWLKTEFATKQLSGLFWRTSCALVLPVMVFENSGPIQSIKRSAFLIHNTWGTVLTPRVGISAVIIPIQFIMIIPFLIALLIGGKIIIIAGAIVSGILVLIAGMLSIATQTILLGALYLFAIGKNVAPHFDLELLQKAFRAEHTATTIPQ